MACSSLRVRVHRDEGTDGDDADEIRQFNMDVSNGQDLQYEKLERKIKDVFKLESSYSAALYWKDLDKKMIRFSSDDEMELAIKERSCFSYNTLNIYLKVIQKSIFKKISYPSPNVISRPCSLDSFSDHEHEKEPEAKAGFNKDPDSVEQVASVSPVSSQLNLLSDTDDTVTNPPPFYNITDNHDSMSLASLEAEASIPQASTELVISARSKEVDVTDDDGTRNTQTSAYDTDYHNRETVACGTPAVGSLEVHTSLLSHNMTATTTVFSGTKSKKKKKKKEYTVQMVHTVEEVFPLPTIGTKLDVGSKNMVGIEQTDSGFDSTDPSMIDNWMLDQLRDVVSSKNKKPVDVCRNAEPLIFDEPVATSPPIQDTEPPDIDGAAVEQMRVGKGEYRLGYDNVKKWMDLVDKEEKDQVDGKNQEEEEKKEQSLFEWIPGWMRSTATLFNGLQLNSGNCYRDVQLPIQETESHDYDSYYIDCLQEAKKRSMAVVEKALKALADDEQK